jgi:hypothetical protein
VCVCVYVFIQDPDPDPEFSEKSDPGSDPKKSFRIHNTDFFNRDGSSRYIILF